MENFILSFRISINMQQYLFITLQQGVSWQTLYNIFFFLSRVDDSTRSLFILFYFINVYVKIKLKAFIWIVSYVATIIVEQIWQWV